MQEVVVSHPPEPEETYRPRQAEGTLFVAELGDLLCGFGACQAFEDGLHLWELAVRQETQGRGVGRALVTAIVAGALERGLPAVTLTTFRSIPFNAPFYERLGFVILDDAALNKRLRAVLAAEAERGLTDRCAMRLAL